MRRAWLILACLMPVLALAACGSSEPEATGAGTGGAEAGNAAGPLPAVDVLDLRDGATVSLPEVPEAGTPLLVWFWAPH